MKTHKIFGCVVFLLAVSACASSSDSEDGLEYKSLPFDSAEPVTSDLAGTGFRSGSDQSESLIETSGSLTHNTGELVIYHAGLAITNATNYEIDTQRFSSRYEYVQSYDLDYSVEGIPDPIDYNISAGIHGIVTRAQDMAAITGQAIYNGEMSGYIILDGQTNELMGSSEIDVDFGDSSVDIVLRANAVAIQDRDDLTRTDTIRVTGMRIEANRFSLDNGGLINLSSLFSDRATSDVKVFSGDAVGYFYGWDSDKGRPAEIGGSVLVKQGPDLLNAGFIGD